MENNTSPVTPSMLPAVEAQISKVKSRKNLYITIGVLSVILVFSIWIFSSTVNRKNKDLEIYDSTLKVANITISQLAYEFDSAKRAIEYLSTYKSLTDAVAYREEVRASFRYKPGDLVWLKVDSSRVLLQDIIIGGDRNSYYVKYRIQNRDRSIEEISPQFVY